jgi:hypothetical protein
MSLHVVYTEGAYSVLGEWQCGRWVQFDIHLNLEKVREGVYVSDDSDGPFTSESEAYARARELDAALADRTLGVEVRCHQEEAPADADGSGGRRG